MRQNAIDTKHNCAWKNGYDNVEYVKTSQAYFQPRKFTPEFPSNHCLRCELEIRKKYFVSDAYR